MKLLSCYICKKSFPIWGPHLDRHLIHTHKVNYDDLNNYFFQYNAFPNHCEIQSVQVLPSTLLSSCLDINLLNMKCLEAFNFIDQAVNNNRCNFQIVQYKSYLNLKTDYFTELISIFYNYIFDSLVCNTNLKGPLSYDAKLTQLVNTLIGTQSFIRYFHKCHKNKLKYTIERVCKQKSDKITNWFSKQICLCIQKNIKIILILLCQTNDFPCKDETILYSISLLLKCMTQEILEQSYPGYRHAKTFLKRLRHPDRSFLCCRRRRRRFSC